MTKTLSRLALGAFLAAGITHAAPFSGKGVPADAGAFVHIDMEAAGDSPLIKALREVGESAAMKAEDKSAFDKLKAELGVAPEDVKDLTAFFPLPDKAAGASADVSRELTVLLRGKFNRAKLLAIPTKHPEVKANKLGKHVWFSGADLDKAFGAKGGAAKSKSENLCVCPVDDSTVLLASDTTSLSRSLAAMSGAQYRPDASAAALLAGKPVVAGYFGEAFVAAATAKPQAPAQAGASPELKALSFSLGETAGNLKLRVDARMSSAEGATQVHSQAAMFQGFAQMGLAQEKPGETAQEKADKAFGASVLQALKLAAAGDLFTVDFAYPSDKLAAKLLEKKGDIAKAIAAKSGGAAPAGKPDPFAP